MSKLVLVFLVSATLVGCQSPGLNKRQPLSNQEIFERLVYNQVPRLSGHVFDTIPDTDLWYAVADHFSCKGYAAGEDPLSMRLPEAAKTILLIQNLNGEVENGGLDQFFFNQKGRHLNETLNAARLALNPQCASIYQEALEWYRDSKRRGLSEIDTAPRLDGLDKKWYKAFSEADVIAYIRKHRAELLDTPAELKTSEWLGEPDQYHPFKSTIADVGESVRETSSPNQRLVEVSEKCFAASKEAEVRNDHSNAEAYYRLCLQTLGSVRPATGTNGSMWGRGFEHYAGTLGVIRPEASVQADGIWQQALKEYAEFLKKRGRVVQANAVEWELANHPHPRPIPYL